MSLWDRYFAPGDIRHQRQLEEQKKLSATSSVTREQRLPVIPHRIDAAHRARRQNALFFGGIGFTFLSLFITRRALRRRQPAISTTPNQAPTETSKVDGGFEAVEALFLATINVAALGITAVGGAMKVLDVADVEDLREIVRKSAGYDVYGGESEGDKEIEGWIAEVLSRKDADGKEATSSLGGLRDAVAGKIGQMIEEERKAKDENKEKRIEIRAVEGRR